MMQMAVLKLAGSRLAAASVSVRAMSTKTADIVVFDYEELCAEPTESTVSKVKEAYGYDGLGILAVRGVPGFVEQRAKMLPMAFQLANLPEEQLKELEHPDSYYSFGWSRGKEQFEGQPDFSKGSFYANPLFDMPTDSEELIREFPAFYLPNIWPKKQLPELEPTFKGLGRTIVDTATILARHCDKLVESEMPTYPKGFLTALLKESRMCKGRLLNYFPVPEEDLKSAKTSSESSWCGWHNDHGSITGLTPAMYFDKDGNEIPCPDSDSGLYIKSRHGEVYRVVAPSDCIAYQIGETAQIHSGGVLQATPHAVRATPSADVSRGTLAIFMEPEAWSKMSVPEGADPNRALVGASGELLPPGVPPLAGRWTNTDTFGEFTHKTLTSYY